MNLVVSNGFGFVGAEGSQGSQGSPYCDVQLLRCRGLVSGFQGLAVEGMESQGLGISIWDASIRVQDVGFF